MLRSLLTTLFVGLAACGGDRFDATSFCERLATHACDAFDACGCPASSTCADDQEASCVRAFAGYVGAQALGVLEADGAAAEACLATYAEVTGSCAAPTEQNQPRACQNIFRDPAALGATCDPISVGLLCAEGAGACDAMQVCAGLVSADGACGLTGRCDGDAVCDGGVCTLPGDAGAPCSGAVGCADGLTCVEGACAPPAPQGAACASTEACGAGLECAAGVCADALPRGEACPGSGCGQGATCAPTADARACAPLAALGEVCEGWDTCEAGLLCDYLQTPARCTPLPVAGEACPASACDDRATCVAGTCVLRAAVGEPCAATYLGCVEGAACDLTSGVCAALGGEGSACLGDERACAEGWLCDPFGPSGVCIAPLPEGASCQGVVGVCEDGLYCGGPGLVCTPIVAEGLACDTFDACGPSALCTNGVCEALPDVEGAACVYDCDGDLRCAAAPGVCAAGVCALAQVPPATPQ